MILEYAAVMLKDELKEFQRRLKKAVASSDGIAPLTTHFVDFQGKHLRPVIIMLSAKAVAPGKSLRGNHFDMSVVLELIHNAALVHDDVLDDAKLRRRVKTYNQRWGNEMAVIFGDYLFARLFAHLSTVESAELFKTIADTCNQLCLGELNHLRRRFDFEGMSEKDYLDIINQKTASLFGLAAYLGAALTTKDIKMVRALEQFGRNFGMAYQMMDDYQDIVVSDKDSGKSSGNDLPKGKITLPVIHAIRHTPQIGQTKLKKLIKSIALANRNLPAQNKELRQCLEASGSLAYTRQQAESYIDKAINNLAAVPDSVYKELLVALAKSIG